MFQIKIKYILLHKKTTILKLQHKRNQIESTETVKIYTNKTYINNTDSFNNIDDYNSDIPEKWNTAKRIVFIERIPANSTKNFIAKTYTSDYIKDGPNKSLRKYNLIFNPDEYKKPQINARFHAVKVNENSTSSAASDSASANSDSSSEKDSITFINTPRSNQRQKNEIRKAKQRENIILQLKTTVKTSKPTNQKSKDIDNGNINKNLQTKLPISIRINKQAKLIRAGVYKQNQANADKIWRRRLMNRKNLSVHNMDEPYDVTAPYKKKEYIKKKAHINKLKGVKKASYYDNYNKIEYIKYKPVKKTILKNKHRNEDFDEKIIEIYNANAGNYNEDDETLASNTEEIIPNQILIENQDLNKNITVDSDIVSEIVSIVSVENKDSSSDKVFDIDNNYKQDQETSEDIDEDYKGDSSNNFEYIKRNVVGDRDRVSSNSNYKKKKVYLLPSLEKHIMNGDKKVKNNQRNRLKVVRNFVPNTHKVKKNHIIMGGNSKTLASNKNGYPTKSKHYIIYSKLNPIQSLNVKRNILQKMFKKNKPPASPIGVIKVIHQLNDNSNDIVTSKSSHKTTTLNPMNEPPITETNKPTTTDGHNESQAVNLQKLLFKMTEKRMLENITDYVIGKMLQELSINESKAGDSIEKIEIILDLEKRNKDRVLSGHFYNDQLLLEQKKLKIK